MSTRPKNAAAIEAYIKELKNLGAEMDDIAWDVASQLMEGVEANAVKLSPVGEYDKPVDFVTKEGKHVHFQPHSGKIGGFLRKMWSHEEPKKVGRKWRGKVQNNASYAAYVNDGHRIVRNGITVGFVPGQFFLERAVKSARRGLPGLWRDEVARVKKKTGF